jgi:hypothetical protein
MMGGVTCPNCGKDNPDFLDNCQFCQTPLRRESTLNIGENPTKKTTGELEGVLPDWLREARQQGRESAEEEAKKEATKPRIEKAEPPDLLAGLAFQAASDEDEVPDWLAAINPVEKKIPPVPSKPVEEEPSDFFARFNQSAPASTPASPATTQSESPAWMANSKDDSQKDELAGWFSQSSEQSGDSQSDNRFTPASQEPVKPVEPEDLGWLHDLESSANQTPASNPADTDWMANLPSASAQPSGSQDDLSWLNNLGGTPAPSFDKPAPLQPSSPDDLGWLNNLGSTSAPSFDIPAPSQPAPQEDLSWLNNLGGTSAPSFDTPAPSQPAPQEDLSWLNNLGGTPLPSFDSSTPSQPAPQEDLSWLNNLGGTPAPLLDTPAPSQPAPQEDLSWLNSLGGTPPSNDAPASSQPASQEDLSWLNNLGGTPTPPQPTSSQDDLGWLNNLGSTPAPSFDEPVSPRPAPQEDLGWLNSLGGTPAPSFDESASPQQPAPQEDLSWLNSLGSTPAPSFDEPVPAKPTSSQDDLGWLSNLGDVPAASEPASFAQPEEDWVKNIDNQQGASATPTPLSPAHTAPLSPEAAQSMPDWLRSATESAAMPSMPPLGATSMDWFKSQEKPSADQTPQPSGQTQSEPAPVDQNLFATPSDSSSLSNQDVDSLFAVDMPDWLSKPAESAIDETSASTDISSGQGDELAPVNLPSWVQAMRPVEAAISDVSAVSADQNTEKEGPLAGLRGVIPFAPVGSAQRPRSISLKLQATEEQQTTAALLEQILASETTAHPLKTTPFVVSQRVLRWSLTAIFLIVLGVMIGMGTQIMPIMISTSQTTDISNMSTTIQSIPESAPVLVVIDYEPALAGEMEASAGPLLDQLVVTRKPNLTFISNSPNGSALAERLMTNTKINQAGLQYFNIGYLPGGSAGVQGFVAQPKTIMPAVNINLFSDFAAVIVISDHAESGLVWIEQLALMKQTDPALVKQPLLVVASAQAGPLLQPYVSSKQVNGMVTGLSDAARYEFMNGSRPGIAQSYWDAFGVGLIMAVLAIGIGSLWSLIAGIRARRAEVELG